MIDDKSPTVWKRHASRAAESLWRRFVVAALVFVICLGLTLAPSSAFAIGINDVDGKSDEELGDLNWETREVSTSSSTVKCGLWAILVSSVWRGYGHHCIGDEESHYKLLAMEGVSLALLTGAALMGSLSNDDKALSATWKTMFHFGTTLFLASYIFDVLGTFKGNAFDFDENQRDPYGHTMSLKIRWLPSEEFNLGAQINYVYRNSYFWLNPYAYIDIVDFKSWSAGVDLGVSLWHADNPRTYLAIAADTKFEEIRPEHYYSLDVIPYLEFSLDLGTWFENMAQLRFVNRLGVGIDLYDFRRPGLKPFSDFDVILVLESELSLNLFRDLNFAFIYRYRPDYFIGQLSGPSRIFSTIPVPGVGIFSIDLGFSISNGWQAELEANFGNSIDFWLGVAKTF